MNWGEIWSHYTEILTDPAHCLVEFTFVLADYLVIGAVANRLKRHFHKDLAHEHARIETEHDLVHPRQDGDWVKDFGFGGFLPVEAPDLVPGPHNEQAVS